MLFWAVAEMAVLERYQHISKSIDAIRLIFPPYDLTELWENSTPLWARRRKLFERWDQPRNNGAEVPSEEVNAAEMPTARCCARLCCARARVRRLRDDARR